MKKLLLLIDFSVQLFLLTVIVGGFLATPLTFDFVVFSLLGCFVLGAWQLSSGILKAIFLRSRIYGYYAVSAIGYLAFLGAVVASYGYVGPHLQLPDYLSGFVIWLPALGGAFWCTHQAWKDWRQTVTATQLTWV